MGPEKESFKKVQKIEIFQRGKSMLFVKNRPFYRLCFLGKSRQGRWFFFIIVDKKILFRPKKGSFEKKKKNLNFPMGLVHSFC